MKKKIYLIYELLFIVTFLIELIIYLCSNSSLFGLLYLVTNLLGIFIIAISIYNYNECNLKVRLSKNIIFIILIIFSLILSSFKFNDSSSDLIENMDTFIKYIKPSLIILLLGISIFDYKYKEVFKYKAKK